MKTFNILLKNLLLFNVALEFALAQVNNFELPKPGECGTLNEQYLYNEKRQLEVDEFPWFGHIKFKETRDGTSFFLCVAVLISQRHLLANAQCFQNMQQREPIAVLLGQTASNTTATCEHRGECVLYPGQAYEIAEIALHPNYNAQTPLHQNDVAVVTLTADVSFTAHIRPICLPPPSASVNANYVAQYLPYAGYESFSSDAKIKTTGHVLSPRRCRDSADAGMKVTAQHICVTCDNHNIFLTGSALMGVAVVNAEPRYFYLIGLLSDGGIFWSPDTPHIFAAVAPYLNWIRYNAV